MVYRGKVFKSMVGLYFYGDFCTGRIWGLRNLGTTWENTLLADTPFQITSFGEDEAGQIYVTDFLTGSIYRIMVQPLVAGDFDGDGSSDFASLNVLGRIFYTTNLSAFANVPGVLSQLVSGDFNFDGSADLAGLASDGTIWVSTDLTSFTPIPGILSSLISGDFNSLRGGDEFAGLALDGSIWFTTNLNTWTNIPGKLTNLVPGNYDGASPDDLVGLAMEGSLWLTTDLLNWTNIGRLP